ncbi:hypothetical protein PHISCL_08441 [Aspergillus sclerotialis]|uniref:EGF domain-specific O-linked N-acetylglucosamine transferase n=1 Tax=Aspergillus sclerotialis TaxID=2070753 RepID=A0A3A2Z8I2_9EURO|nr:hypothetical protein PHISCL_08441 [Aspergillus sclerotialis]
MSVEEKPLEFPPEYSVDLFESPFCADRFGSQYLEHLRDSATEYCTPQSSSTLTCFHVRVTDDYRIDTLCMGRDAFFDPASRKFDLGCELAELSAPKTLASIPDYGKFHNYWYNTGPQVVLDGWVNLDDNIRGRAPPDTPNYTILVKREGSENLWHCLMEIFSMTMTLDVLQISPRLNESRPFLTAADAANTQVVLLDDKSDGPYFDLWSVFAQKPTLRIKDVPDNTTFENIIVPLAGGSNPLWQGDWEIHSCENSLLLRTFSRRVLDIYDLGTREPRQGDQIVVTFINRTGSRRLVDQEEYLKKLQSTFANVKVQSGDFADILFHEQLEIIQDTDVLVGVHGAGLTHAMFLQPRSAVVEILPPTLNHKGFRNLACLMGHSYFSAHGFEPTLSKRRDWQRDDVYFEQNKFMELLDTAIKTMYNKGQRNYDVV